LHPRMLEHSPWGGALTRFFFKTVDEKLAKGLLIFDAE
jgi:hypothetical protein